MRTLTLFVLTAFMLVTAGRFLHSHTSGQHTYDKSTAVVLASDHCTVCDYLSHHAVESHVVAVLSIYFLQGSAVKEPIAVVRPAISVTSSPDALRGPPANKP